jgi:hypothetical protein
MTAELCQDTTPPVELWRQLTLSLLYGSEFASFTLAQRCEIFQVEAEEEEQREREQQEQEWEEQEWEDWLVGWTDDGPDDRADWNTNNESRTATR